MSPRVHHSAIKMHSLLTKAKDLGLKGREKLEQYSSGKLGSDEGSREGSPSISRKRREAALKADLFAGPDKIVSAGNTYGLIKLTVHEARVPSEQRYCAVVSIGMQVNKQVLHPGSSHWSPSAELTARQALCCRRICQGLSPRQQAILCLRKVGPAAHSNHGLTVPQQYAKQRLC